MMQTLTVRDLRDLLTRIAIEFDTAFLDEDGRALMRDVHDVRILIDRIVSGSHCGHALDETILDATTDPETEMERMAMAMRGLGRSAALEDGCVVVEHAKRRDQRWAIRRPNGNWGVDLVDAYGREILSFAEPRSADWPAVQAVAPLLAQIQQAEGL
jgi:hypothetical protein